jgi:serine protease AprX
VKRKSEGVLRAASSARGGRELDPLPIADRIGADDVHTGRGIVAAFIDSGFYPHPDLVTPFSRIHAFQDVIHDKSGTELLGASDVSAWHGMMSTVVAAGNGALSGGRFRSLAPDLGLVLVKAGTLQRVHHDDIARAIEWVLVNRARFDIRILNISCGGDYEVSYLHDPLSRFAEACVRAGIVVVCAVGNSGHRPGYVVPPASVPCVISVGGIDDEGNPHLGRIMAYRSSFGPTIDGIQKPEIVTLADWLPAPILPETPTHKQARLLHRLSQTPDEELHAVIADNEGIFPALDEAKERPAYLIRQIITAGLHDEKVIDEHYKMVDGTSFSAPIVSSVVAQMLQANPALGPSEVKRILIQTARRVPQIDFDRQGWGALQPKAAVERAMQLRKA